MECPVRFNVWGKIIPAQRDEALSAIREQSIFPSEIESRKAINNALRTNTALQITSALGYAEAQAFLVRASAVFAELTYCQEGWPPSDEGSFCAEHNFHFGGCLGCHVCRDFYVK